MLKVARSMVVPAGMLLLAGSVVVLFYLEWSASERRNAELHRVGIEHRARLDEENKASMRDRARIADHLDRIERQLGGRP